VGSNARILVIGFDVADGPREDFGHSNRLTCGVNIWPKCLPGSVDEMKDALMDVAATRPLPLAMKTVDQPHNG
jgi:hypothetical protein